MKKLIGIGLAVLSVLVFSAALTGNSEARSFSAFLGQAQNPADYTCFTNSGGAVTNRCATTRRFCVALPVDSNGHTVEATMYSPDSAHFTGCFAQAMNRYGAGTSWTGMRYTSTVGAHQVVTLGSLNVPNAGALYACCDIPTGGVVDAFNYSN